MLELVDTYQQGIDAPDDAETEARPALGDVDGGLTAGDNGAGRGVRGQGARGQRATRT